MTNKVNLGRQLAGALTSGAERAKVRAELASELGYDANNLTTHESIRLDTVCTLISEINTLQSQQAAGKTIDVGRLIMANTALTELLNPSGSGMKVIFQTLPVEVPDGCVPTTEDLYIADLTAKLAQRDEEIGRLKALLAAKPGVTTEAPLEVPKPAVETPQRPVVKAAQEPPKPAPQPTPAEIIKDTRPDKDAPWRTYDPMGGTGWASPAMWRNNNILK